MSTLQDILREATRRLEDAGVDNPQLDARLLLEAATGLGHVDLVVRPDAVVGAEEMFLFEHLLTRRAAREPVARILGQREFWGLPFALSAATLEPRPDSETLIEAMLQHRPDRKRAYRLLDLGTGTGCLLAALLSEYPQATGLGIDAAELAVVTAERNMASLGFAARASIRLGNWGQDVEGVFDLIISNPPYIRRDAELQPEVARHDPALALFAGVDGLEAYRAILAQLPKLLAQDGVAVLELGIGQGAAVSAIALQNQLKVLQIHDDLGGIARALVVEKK